MADIRSKLAKDLEEATARTESASMEFDAIMGDLPRDIPYSDRTQRIHSASRELTATRKEMVKAHTRLNDYLSRGIVPEDMKRSG